MRGKRDLHPKLPEDWPRPQWWLTSSRASVARRAMAETPIPPPTTGGVSGSRRAPWAAGSGWWICGGLEAEGTGTQGLSHSHPIVSIWISSGGQGSPLRHGTVATTSEYGVTAPVVGSRRSAATPPPLTRRGRRQVRGGANGRSTAREGNRHQRL